MAEWGYIATAIAVTAPLVGAPLTAITFYVRTLREQITGKLGELTQRVDHLDGLVEALSQRVREVDRDFVNKEEWVRESMLARGERQWLSEAVVRLETGIETTRDGAGPAGRMDRAAQALVAASAKLESACNGLGGAAATTPGRPEEQS